VRVERAVKHELIHSNENVESVTWKILFSEEVLRVAAYLRDEGDLPAVPVEVVLSDVRTVHAHLSFVRVIEPLQQLHDRALPACANVILLEQIKKTRETLFYETVCRTKTIYAAMTVLIHRLSQNISKQKD
jgi:hypothetical protein